MEPFNPTPSVNKNTVNTRLQPVYEAIIKHMAGLYWPDDWERKEKNKKKVVFYLFAFKFASKKTQITFANIPNELITLRVPVCEKRSEQIIQSATTEITIENSHIAKYGRADNVPF